VKLLPLVWLLYFALILACTPPVFASEFDEIDRNHDGVVSRVEWNAWKSKTSHSDIVAEEVPSRPQASSNEHKGVDIIKWIERNFEIRESFFSSGSTSPPGSSAEFASLSSSVASTASSEPARVSWTKPSNGSAFYQLDAAVLWRPYFLSSGTEFLGNPIAWFIEPTFETHVSSEPGSAQNQLTYRSPVTFEYFPGGKEILAGMDNPNAVPTRRFITVNTFIISPTYQTDQDNNTRLIEGELFYTPTIPSLAIGIRQPVFGLKKVQFRWRPYTGFELGDYLSQNKATGFASESNISRFVFRAAADLSLGERFSLTGSYVSRIEVGEAGKSFNYGQVSGQLFLDPTLPANDEPPHFSIGITYEKGNDAPDFTNVDSVNAWLGVRF
jgi:hypothetical protein